MKSTKKFDVVYGVPYKLSTGETAYKNINCGSVLEREDGSMTMILDVMPPLGTFISLWAPRKPKAVAPVVEQTAEQTPF